MVIARLAEVRLHRFKSFHGATVPLGDLTILTGRNSSGKSNVLDAIEVLSRISGGELLGDALDGGRREGGPVRGGSRGCAPYGETSFKIGCRIEIGDDGTALDYDVEVGVDPTLRIRDERLVQTGAGEEKTWFEVRRASRENLEISYRSGVNGSSRLAAMRNDRSVLGQIRTALVVETETVRQLVGRAMTVADALANTFNLDPEPRLMRNYVPPGEYRLRRSGENLAATVLHLRAANPGRFQDLEDMLRIVSDCNMESLDFSWTDEGQVMLALDEGRGRRTTARLMSDGTLRFSAVVTALMTASTSLDIGGSGPASPAFDAPAPGVVLAIEEIENGLHPSHAARLLDLVESVSRQPGVSVLLTTHSPALLDAINGKALRDVLVCHGGRVSPLVDLPGYATEMAGGSLGRVVSRGGLVAAETRSADDYSGFLHMIGTVS